LPSARATHREALDKSPPRSQPSTVPSPRPRGPPSCTSPPSLRTFASARAAHRAAFDNFGILSPPPHPPSLSPPCPPGPPSPPTLSPPSPARALEAVRGASAPVAVRGAQGAATVDDALPRQPRSDANGSSCCSGIAFSFCELLPPASANRSCTGAQIWSLRGGGSECRRMCEYMKGRARVSRNVRVCALSARVIKREPIQPTL